MFRKAFRTNSTNPNGLPTSPSTPNGSGTPLPATTNGSVATTRSPTPNPNSLPIQSPGLSSSIPTSHHSNSNAFNLNPISALSSSSNPNPNPPPVAGMNEFTQPGQVEKEIELEVPESHKDLEGKRFFGLENVSLAGAGVCVDGGGCVVLIPCVELVGWSSPSVVRKHLLLQFSPPGTLPLRPLPTTHRFIPQPYTRYDPRRSYAHRDRSHLCGHGC